MFGFKVVTQYEQGIAFRFGRPSRLRGPGLTWVNPFTDRLRKVNMQIVVAVCSRPGRDHPRQRHP
jgi:regulator of protease activity HflC (stomatin/prohibitin superfamily)